VRITQSDAVDEIQSNLTSLNHDLADRSFNPATDVGTMIRQAAPDE
jgi:hypothetical protein